MIYTDHTNIPKTNAILMAEHRFCFVYVPKVACTSWKVLFSKMCGVARATDLAIVHSRKMSGFKFAQSEAEVLDSGLPVYAMVRHPAERMLSAYLDKIVRHRPEDPKKDIFSLIALEINRWVGRREPQNGAAPPPSFLDFLKWVRWSGHPCSINEHWIPQSKLLPSNLADVDFLGRFENFSVDAEDILNRIACQFEFPSQSSIGFESTGAAEKASTFIDDEALVIIEDLFACDYEKFGYRPTNM